MRVYKCDICGKYCEDCHNVYGNIAIQTEKNNFKKMKNAKMKNINELCDSCFEDLQRYVQDKYFEYMDKNSK